VCLPGSFRRVLALVPGARAVNPLVNTHHASTGVNVTLHQRSSKSRSQPQDESGGFLRHGTSTIGGIQQPIISQRKID
jgi:hypothetical protein